MKNRENPIIWATLACITALLLIVAFWYFSSAMEAAAFNRATGKHVTAWDAMWVELRVQEGAK